MTEYLWILTVGLVMAFGLAAVFIGRLMAKTKQQPLPMPPASDEIVDVASAAITEAGDREQDMITEAGTDPRAAAALAALRRGKR